jgi:hypothetical protein
VQPAPASPTSPLKLTQSQQRLASLERDLERAIHVLRVAEGRVERMDRGRRRGGRERMEGERRWKVEGGR